MRGVLAMVLILTAVPALAEPEAEKQTLGKPNGHWWNGATKVERETHVKGVIDGLFMAARYTCAKEEYRALLPEGSYVDITAALTHFFADRANEVIPVESAWVYFAAKNNGATAEQLAEMVRQWRSLLAGR